MAPMKRKIGEEASSARPEKKSRSTPVAKRSVLRNEEPSFPRGGASVLTPLEYKQIQIQATQDALFEQKTGKRVENDFEDDEQDENIPEEAGAAVSKSKHKPKSKSKRDKAISHVAESSVRIEGLSYKRLVPGSLVLGQISQINRLDIALSLPNNLTGYVPLAAISDQSLKRSESLIEERDGEEDGNIEAVDLKSLVSNGQYLRAFVVSTEHEDSSGNKGKRHIELSVNPREANAGLSKDDLVPNSMIQASVLSVEDHGLVMDLGLSEADIRGFMSNKELGPDVDISQVQEGAVFLCLVLGRNSNGKIIKLSADPTRIGILKKGGYVTDAPTIDSFLPGTAVEFLVSEVSPSGIAGKVMGLLNVTADFIHSGAASSGKDLEQKYNVGSKAKGRIICSFPTVEEKKVGVSLQDHVVNWRSKASTSINATDILLPSEHLPISSKVDQATVVKVEPGLGLLLDVGVKGVRGFVHISKVSDGKVETLAESTGPYKLGSQHQARILGYNSMDGLYIATMEQKVIQQPFLRIEDVQVGQTVKGTIEKILIGADGVSGVLINIAEGITGLCPETHLADIHLQNPERKFKVGTPVTARVLSILPEKKQIRLTLKKSLVNSDVDPWISYSNLKPGQQAPGTLLSVVPAGAVVQFYGPVRGFLPRSEMSEAYIQDPKQHFKNGQVVNVRIVSVDAVEGRMIVSCKDPALFGEAEEAAFRNLKLGEKVVGNVIEKTSDEIIVVLEPSGLKAFLSNSHLADGSPHKSQLMANRIRVGQLLKDLIILNKQETQRMLRLTSKPSLIGAAQEGKLLKAFEDVVEESEVQGFVSNVTPTGVYVRFAGELTALLLKQHLPEESIRLPDFGMSKNQSVKAKVLSIDYGQRRFLLSLKPQKLATSPETSNPKAVDTYDKSLSHPVDGVSSNIDDFTLGKLTKAQIISIKETQLNVQLADAVQGRVDVSEVFDTWEDISDRKRPLKKFHTKQIIPVKILGIHDSRNHRFLPISHRGKAPVFELTAKPSNQTASDLDTLSINKVQVDSTWLVFVNNVSDDCVWVSLSPNVRGRIRAIDISDNVSQLNDLAKHFPIGSVLRAKVIKVDVENNRLDLSARPGGTSGPTKLNDLATGSVLPGRVTKVTDRQVIVQLSESISAPIHLVDLADDYSKADPTLYSKNQTVRVYVKNIDVPNKKVTLSTRPSKVLSSSLPVKDPDITSITQLKVNDIVRGFIKNVADNGLFVSLASNVTAFIRVTDLSDAFLKEWKSGFEVDQLVEGKIIAMDTTLNHLQMSLRTSHMENDYKPPLTFSNMSNGLVVTGKVRKVEDFGVFIVVDNSANLSGLCHRTKMSDQTDINPKKLYEEGDAVQAKVLSINKEKKQISFGLKASYFEARQGRTKASEPVKFNDQDLQESDDHATSDSDISIDENKGARLNQAKDGDNGRVSGHQIDLEDVPDIDSDVDMNSQTSPGARISKVNGGMSSSPKRYEGLSTGGFDWTGGMSGVDGSTVPSDTDTESLKPQKKKRRKAEIKIDKTGDLDAHGPQSTGDFERLLMGRPNSSILWLEYMAFQLKLSEVSKAREIAERALKFIHIREESEKMNIWIAMLNLENTYGSDETLDAVFRRAIQYNDSLEIHSRLASIYIQSQAYSKADDLFHSALKKHSQSPDLYINYATFLMTELDALDRARALLPRAMQALPSHTHLSLTSKFAQLEFTTPHGSPERGRTVFETLLSQWPKRLDLWNILLDLEIKQGDKDIIRRLFERVTGGSNLKARKAKFFFKKWLDWETKIGNEKGQERVKALAAEYVRAQGKQVDDIQ